MSDLFGRLSGQLGELARTEVELARTEVAASAARASRGGLLVGAGGALLYAGLLTLVAALVAGLIAAGVEPWIAALGVGLAIVVLGGLVLQAGRSSLASASVVPRRTIETLRDDATLLEDVR